MIRRIILMILAVVAFGISACSPKTNTVEVTPTTEVIEQTIEVEIGE